MAHHFRHFKSTSSLWRKLQNTITLSDTLSHFVDAPMFSHVNIHIHRLSCVLPWKVKNVTWMEEHNEIRNISHSPGKTEYHVLRLWSVVGCFVVHLLLISMWVFRILYYVTSCILHVLINISAYRLFSKLEIIEIPQRSDNKKQYQDHGRLCLFSDRLKQWKYGKKDDRHLFYFLSIHSTLIEVISKQMK